MKATFLTAVNNISLAAIAGRGDRLDGAFFLATDPGNLGALLPREAHAEIGGIELGRLRNAPAYVYASDDIPSTAGSLTLYVSAGLEMTRRFLDTLWLLKDHAVSSTSGYAWAFDPALGFGVTSAVAERSAFTATGKRETVSFTREELRRIRLPFTSALHEGTSTGPGEQESTARFERALHWIQVAREEGDLGIRLAAYCTAFEALLSTSSYEVAHQIAERLAILLTLRTPSPPLDTYRTLKRAYTVRSQILHGAKVSRDIKADTEALSVSCDELSRSALLTVMDNPILGRVFHGSQQHLDDFFLKLLLGGKPESAFRDTEGPGNLPT